MREWETIWKDLPSGTKRAVATAIAIAGESLNERCPGGLADPESRGEDLFKRLAAMAQRSAALLQNAKPLFESVPRGETKDFLDLVRAWSKAHDPHSEGR